MEDRDSRWLTGLTTGFCCLYVAWLSYHLGDWVRAFTPLMEGATGMPPVTRFVTNLPKSVLLTGGALLIAGLIAKEFFIKRFVVRTTVTFLVFMAVNWFAAFCVGAIVSFMKDIVDKIG